MTTAARTLSTIFSGVQKPPGGHKAMHNSVGSAGTTDGRRQEMVCAVSQTQPLPRGIKQVSGLAGEWVYLGAFSGARTSPRAQFMARSRVLRPCSCRTLSEDPIDESGQAMHERNRGKDHLVYRRWIICRRASSLTGRSFSRRVERTDRAVLWIPEFMPIVLALRGLNQGLVVGTGRRMVIQSTLGEARRRMKSFPTVCGRAALIKRFFSPQIRGTTKAPVPDNRSHIGLEFGLRRRGQQPCKPPGGTPNPEISEETQAPIHPPVRPYRSFFFLRTLWDATKPVPVSRVESFTSDERPAGPA
ncbi:uncharacterized protein B0H64DRAFT_163173 [Chaetomium fimeti]|uniref:Uncharacterized protein n=1 Tax=Chaetomium fimeti TaxID=1854472 RepID=A0AAE0LSD4_9PEZI|nr:hypothetical protein B0H64DRAFT_163173 [Chaetomium fimeti]